MKVMATFLSKQNNPIKDHKNTGKAHKTYKITGKTHNTNKSIHRDKVHKKCNSPVPNT